MLNHFKKYDTMKRTAIIYKNGKAGAGGSYGGV